MRNVFLTAAVVVALVVPARAGDREHDALERARRLLDIDARVKIVVIDPELAPDPEALRRLDAFVVREPAGALRPAIYINRGSQILRNAAAGSDFYVRVLAAVIRHEAAHLQGASEAEARRAERDFFQSLIARGDVSTTDGLRYLAQLARRE